mmetsp:Transcript_16618/g.33716  ORF Transcript_16618/g.33716 Transcript_16618/m.33716 type:complete len:149 (-) Transcript_16618:596-1042(-)
MMATEYPVLKLLESEEFNHKGHVVATDNWYTSVNLATKLLHRGIHSIGTNKKGVPKAGVIPKKGKGKKLCGFMQSFKTVIRYFNWKGEIWFTVWQDSKPVHLLHTFPPYATSLIRHLNTDNKFTPKNVPCPKIVPQYNSVMGGTGGLN